ncbi:MAG: LuxR C-terminal-related transcriptional regulator [Caldimonas sp.]
MQEHPAAAAALAQLAPAASNGPAGLASVAVALVRMLDEIDYGMLLVTASGTLRYANQLALRSLSDDAALRTSGGRVCAAREVDQAALRSALADAAAGRRGLLNLDSPRAALSIAVLPLAGGSLGADGEDDEPLVLLVLGRQPIYETLTLHFFARSQKLTAAESTVLHGLCAGQSPDEIAKRVGVAISTIRTQIGSIRAKTGATSIRALTSRVAALPPITPTLKYASAYARA